jgi:transcriptional regulator of acetoin/glycerol metabolism
MALPFSSAHRSVRKSRLGRKPMQMGDDFLRKLQSHSWPGNIRELENAIEQAIIQSRCDGVLTSGPLDFFGVERGALPLERMEAKNLSGMESETILQVLAHCRGNKKRASLELGIGRNTLYRKMKKYNLS